MGRVMVAPTSLIINSAFVEPQQHWAENTDRTLRLEPNRRAAGYEIIDTRENTRRKVSIPLVDDIRQRVSQWRDAGWPGVTSVTLELLTHWWDLDKVSRRQYPFYFCQLEAIETLIWSLEAQPEYRQGISVQGDGGAFERLCNKMATGSGKTTVMAMIITWQVLNALHADIAPALGGAADWSQVVTIDLEKLPEEFRLQRLVFKASQRAFEQLKEQFKGQREYLLFQLVRLVEEFLTSNKIDIPSVFHQEPLRKRILYSLHIDLITQHLMRYVVEQNTLKLEPVFDGERPARVKLVVA